MKFKLKVLAKYLIVARNVVNQEDIDKFLKSFEPQEERITKWLKSNLRNYILNDLDLHDYHKKAGEPSWVDKARERGDKLFEFKESQQFKTDVAHVLDFFKSEDSPKILERVTFPDAKKAAEKWTQKLTRKASNEEDESGVIEVRKYPSNFRWVELTSKKALEREGKLMSHCVGNYFERVNSGNVRIFSLRDNQNRPHTTIELAKNKIEQIKGFANQGVKEEYVKYVKDFLEKKPKGIKFEKVEDLLNIGILDIDGTWYDIYRLPKNLTIKRNLDLSGTQIKELPSDLKVGGGLYLSGTQIKELPSDLKVGGGLYLSGTQIKEMKIPEKFKHKLKRVD